MITCGSSVSIKSQFPQRRVGFSFHQPSLRSSGTSFSKIIGVEIEENKFSLLYRRLNLIKKELNLATDIKLIKGDINEKIDDIANEINQGDYGILFVDPEGIEISLGDLSKILSKSKSIDVILNQSEGVYRLLGKAQNGDSVSLKRLEQYLPTLSNVQQLWDFNVT